MIGGASTERNVILSFHLDVHDGNLQDLLLESLVLFESIINSRWFLRTSIILFLTGVKEFKVKLLKVRYTSNRIRVFLLPSFLFFPSGPPRNMLPRIYRGRGYQQGGQVHSLEIHAGQSGPIKRVPPVNTTPLPTLKCG